MATNTQRIAALEAAATTLQTQVAALQTRVKALELIVNPPAAAIPFDGGFGTEYGGTP